MGCLSNDVQKDRREMMEVNKEIVDKRTQLAVERITQWGSYVEVSVLCLPLDLSGHAAHDPPEEL